VLQNNAAAGFAQWRTLGWNNDASDKTGLESF
jgi:hypothetical protein